MFVGSKREKESSRDIKDLIILRKVEIALSPMFYVKICLKDDGYYLYCDYGKYVFKIPPNKTARRLIREIIRLEPAIISRKVRLDDLRLAVWALYAPIRSLYPYRTKIRKVTGLFKDEKLRNYLIWKRIKSVEFQKVYKH